MSRNRLKKLPKISHQTSWGRHLWTGYLNSGLLCESKLVENLAESQRLSNFRFIRTAWVRPCISIFQSENIEDQIQLEKWRLDENFPAYSDWIWSFGLCISNRWCTAVTDASIDRTKFFKCAVKRKLGNGIDCFWQVWKTFFLLIFPLIFLAVFEKSEWRVNLKWLFGMLVFVTSNMYGNGPDPSVVAASNWSTHPSQWYILASFIKDVFLPIRWGMCWSTLTSKLAVNWWVKILRSAIEDYAIHVKLVEGDIYELDDEAPGC